MILFSAASLDFSFCGDKEGSWCSRALVVS